MGHGKPAGGPRRERVLAQRGRAHGFVRQWKIVNELQNARVGKRLDELAALTGYHPRTIRRDLAALNEAGIFVEQATVGEHTVWRLERECFRGLIDAGLTITELASLYMSRRVLEQLAGSAFAEDLRGAFDKLEEALNPKFRAYLDALPQALDAAPGPVAARGGRDLHVLVERLLTACVGRQRVAMRYHSFASGKVKDYVVEPYLVRYGMAAVYLHAFVPAYQELRTFALGRIRTLSVLDERFEPVVRQAPSNVEPGLGGVVIGPAEHVVLEFDGRSAPYIREKHWHRSQRVEELADGRLRLHLRVPIDWTLTAWILGFGPQVRVVEPASLSARIFERIDEARELYAPRMF